VNLTNDSQLKLQYELPLADDDDDFISFCGSILFPASIDAKSDNLKKFQITNLHLIHASHFCVAILVKVIASHSGNQQNSHSSK
jgi:hypothetical protein